jgi:hypothetical protein
MFRTTDMILIAAMVAAAGFTYTTKHGAEAELSKVRRLEAGIRLEQETIDVLKADWSLLTQPSRLQRLAVNYQSELNLMQIESHQIAGFEDLPAPKMRIEDFIQEASKGIPEGLIDTTVTSGVRP